MLFGLTIIFNKIEVFYQSVINTKPVESKISVDYSQLINVNSFKDLIIISKNGSLDIEMDSRISKASLTLWQLHIRVFNQPSIHITTKLKAYRTVVRPSLLYRCESSLCTKSTSNS